MRASLGAASRTIAGIRSANLRIALRNGTRMRRLPMSGPEIGDIISLEVENVSLALPLPGSGVADAPDGARAVVADEQRAVVHHGDRDRTSPDFAVRRDETGDEVLVFTGGFAMLDRNANHFVAGALLLVPRAVFGGKDIAAIL